MKQLLTSVGICLLLSSSLRAADPQPRSSTAVLAAKVGLGIVVTAGLSYTLWRLYQDMNSDKRYVPTSHYLKDNADQLTRDTVTSMGLGYLTWQSGLYTLEAITDLLDKEKEEKEEEDQA